MKILRIILILVGLLLLLFIGIGFFGPTTMDVEYTTTIDAPVKSVYGHAQDFELWQNWSPWKEADPNMKVTYGEITKGEGAQYSWEGEGSGKGEMSIREAKPNEELGMDIGFDMGNGMEYSTCDMFFNAQGEQTEVTWKFNSSGNDGFVQRIFNVLMPYMLTNQYEKGLSNLEREAKAHPITTVEEKKPLEMGVTEEMLEGFYYIGKRFDGVNTITQKDEMQAMYSESYGQIMGYLTSAGKMDKMVPPPFSLTHAYDRETAVSSFSPAIKISEETAAPDGCQSDYIKPHKAMVYTHKGSYENLSESYQKMVQTLMGKGYTMQLPSYEIYTVDPGTEPDPSKWETKIVIPVEWVE